MTNVRPPHAVLDKAIAFRDRLRAGELCVGAQMTLSDPSVVEIFGHAGYDYLVVDMEHAPHTNDSLRNSLLAAEGTQAVVLARPMRFDPDLVRLALDIGSAGIMCPFVQTRDDAERLVAATRYPPEGTRGFGPRRAGRFGLAAGDYFSGANRAITCAVIIESLLAIENLTEIVAVDGIDAVVIGPADLSIDLGEFGAFDSPEFLDAVGRAERTCRDAGTAYGLAAYSKDHAAERVAAGDTFLLAGGDDVSLREGALGYLTAIRTPQS